MANISEYISKIRTAIYGKDVRGSLADGLDAVNKETEAATALTQETEQRQTSLEKQFDDQIANMTLDDPSSAEIVAGRTNVNTGKSYDTIGRRLDAEYAGVTSQLADIVQPITFFGGNSDGVTPNDEAFSQSKLKGYVFFKQNNNGNAVYYFSSVPDFTGVTIKADKGVKLSLPNMNFSLKTFNFDDNIQIIARDRNNTGLIEKNNYGKMLFASNVIEEVIDIENVSLVEKSTHKQISLDVLQNAAWLTNGEIVDQGDYYTYDTSKISTYSSTNIYGVLIPLAVGDTYSCTFGVSDIESIATSSPTEPRMCVAIPCKKSDGVVDYNNFKLYSLDFQGNHYSSARNVENGVNWAQWSDNKVYSSVSNAYKLCKNNSSLVVYARVIDDKTVEIYINGSYITTLKSEYGFGNEIVFGYIIYSEPFTARISFGDILKFENKKGNWGRNLKVAAFGDSISFGEGTSIAWVEYLDNILSGKRGINRVITYNYAVSGHTSSQQLTVLQGSNIDTVDIVLIMVGANDIQQGVSKEAFKSNVQAMIDICKTKNKPVVLGITPMWISSEEAGYGFNNSNSWAGGYIRSMMLRLAATNGLKIVDIMSAIGEIDPHTTILRDTLHPQSWGVAVISNAFARGIVSTLCVDK